MRLLISIILFLAWLALGYWYKVSADKCCEQNLAPKTIIEAPEDSALPAIKSPAIKVLDPVTFDFGKYKTKTNPEWEAYKSNLLRSLGPDDKLLITGLYRSEEPNPTRNKDLGIARAKAALRLFPSIPRSAIELKSERIDDQVLNGATDITGVRFRTLHINKHVLETADATLVYFPYNSTRRLKNATVEKYLQQLATRVKASKEKVTITGHTDATSSASFNMQLGLQRAEVIRDYLIDLGVPRSQLTTRSKGETQPIADNATAAGRAKNRRTEITISK